jgi:hypothetical protein
MHFDQKKTIIWQKTLHWQEVWQKSWSHPIRKAVLKFQAGGGPITERGKFQYRLPNRVRPGFLPYFLPVQSFLPYNSATTIGMNIRFFLIKMHVFLLYKPEFL